MNDSALPSIFAATEPVVVDTGELDEEQLDDSLIAAFREEILTKFDELGPKIASLERAHVRALSKVKKVQNKSDGNTGEELKNIQSKLRDMHTQSIEMARKVQQLSMSSQTAATLAAPRLLRPVNDSFCDFRDDFDKSLKNIASLSNMLTSKANNITSRLDNIRKLPKAAESSKKEIEDLISQCDENRNLVDILKNKTTDALAKSSESVCKMLEERMNDAELMLAQMNEIADKGVSDSDALAAKIQTEKETLQKSFTSLTGEIERVSTARLGRIKSAIAQYNVKSNAVFEDIQNKMSEEFDLLVNDQAAEPESTFLDDLERAREESELQELLMRLEDLERRIREGDDETEETEEAEIFTQIVDGKEVKYYCYSNGTFHN